MENRLEILRNEIDKIILNEKSDHIRMYISHMYGVARFCTLLAMKRNPVFRRSTRKFPAFLFSLFSFLFPPLDFSLIYNKFLMPFRGFFYWKNFFDML